MQNAISMRAPGMEQKDEEKVYLLLYTGTDEDGSTYKDYEYIMGSDNVIIRVMEKIDSLNIFKSEIILEDKQISLLDRLTILDFQKHRVRKSNDLQRLGYGDFDLNNYIENLFRLENIEKNESSYQHVQNNNSDRENIEYHTIEGGDI